MTGSRALQVALTQRAWQAAALSLDESIRSSQAGGWTVLTGFAHKDWALVWLGRGRVSEVEAAAHVKEDNPRQVRLKGLG